MQVDGIFWSQLGKVQADFGKSFREKHEHHIWLADPGIQDFIRGKHDLGNRMSGFDRDRIFVPLGGPQSGSDCSLAEERCSRSDLRPGSACDDDAETAVQPVVIPGFNGPGGHGQFAFLPRAHICTGSCFPVGMFPLSIAKRIWFLTCTYIGTSLSGLIVKLNVAMVTSSVLLFPPAQTSCLDCCCNLIAVDNPKCGFVGRCFRCMDY